MFSGSKTNKHSAQSDRCSKLTQRKKKQAKTTLYTSVFYQLTIGAKLYRHRGAMAFNAASINKTQNTQLVSLYQGMKKPNDHAEPTKSRTLKKKKKKKLLAFEKKISSLFKRKFRKRTFDITFLFPFFLHFFKQETMFMESDSLFLFLHTVDISYMIYKIFHKFQILPIFQKPNP